MTRRERTQPPSGPAAATAEHGGISLSELKQKSINDLTGLARVVVRMRAFTEVL